MSKLSEYSKFDHLDSSSSDEEDVSRTIVNHPPPQSATQSPLQSTCQDKPLHSTTTTNSTSFTNSNTTTRTNATSATTTTTTTKTTTSSSSSNTTPQQRERTDIPGRYIFEYKGQTIYEWEQSLDDVTIYISLPPMTTCSQVICHILPNVLEVGLKGASHYFIQEPPFSKIKVSESSWYVDVDSKVLTILLVKMHRGETWEYALKGHAQLQQGTHSQTQTSTNTTSSNVLVQQSIQKQLMLERFQEEHPGMDFRNAEFNGSIPDAQTFMGGVNYQ